MKVLVYAILLSVFVMGIQTVFPTMINEYVPFWHSQNVDGVIDDTFLVEVYDYHQENPVFAARPAVTWMIGVLSTYTLLTIPQSFVLVQLLLLALVGVALIWCAQSFRKNVSVFTTLLLFYSSFSILFAFFAPIYTYDDFLQYILLFFSIGFAQRGKWGWYVLTMAIAIWVREPSLILLPSFLILWAEHIKDWKKIGIILLPAVLYWILQYITLDPAIAAANAEYLQADRFAHFAYNTLTPERVREMVFSVVAVLTVPVYVLIRTRQQFPNRLKLAFALAVLLNTTAAIVGTRIQEARILALPLVLIWPIWANSVISLVQKYRLYILLERIVLLFFSIIVVWQFAFVWYQSTDVYAFDSAFQWYASIMLSLLAIHILLYKKVITK